MNASYDVGLARQAVDEFVQSNLDRVDIHKRLADSIEGIFLTSCKNEERYFVEKTPRNLLLMPDLMEWFPNAKFIILTRHPLAIVSSLCKTWGRNGNRWNIWDHYIDLFDSLENLCETLRLGSDRCFTIRYEDFCENPKPTLTNLFGFLDLSPDFSAVENLIDFQVEGIVGDQTSVNQPKIEPSQIDMSVFCNTLRKSWATKYIEQLGREALDLLGYDIDEVRLLLKEQNTSARYIFSDCGMLAKRPVKTYLNICRVRNLLASRGGSHPTQPLQ